MDTVELLQKFADPEVIKSLTFTQKMIGGLITTALGMGITFISLVILQCVIGLLARWSSVKEDSVKEVASPDLARIQVPVNVESVHNEEIVAAITTVLALQLKTSVSNIVIRNIERVEGSSTAWQRAGIAEHMNNSIELHRREAI